MSKEGVALAVAAIAKDGDTIGVGTGSTVDLVVRALGDRVKRESLRLHVIPTSIETAQLCAENRLMVLSPMSVSSIPWGFDGADAIDSKLRMIKGHGGALLQEKVLAVRCERYIIAVDSTKLTDNICQRSLIPVEVIPIALGYVQGELTKLGATAVTLRSGTAGKHGPIITEQGNCLLDVRFNSVREDLEQAIKSIVGVVESGLFLDYVNELFIGYSDRVETRVRV